MTRDEKSILSALRHSGSMQYELVKYMKMSKQMISYHVKNLIKKGFIYDPQPGLNKYKLYNITPSGKKILDEYESHEKMQVDKIENSRWKSIIRNPKNIQKFLFENGFAINPNMKNWIQWYGKINGCDTKINLGKTPSIVITYNPVWSKDQLTGFIMIRDDINEIMRNLDSKWSFGLSVPERLKTAQFTSVDPPSEELMKESAGSQLKVGDFDFNQSHHKEARTEITALDKAVTWSQVPELMKNFNMTLNKMYDEKQKSDQAFTEAMNTFASTIKQMGESQLSTNEKLTALTEAITGLKQVQSGQTEVKPLNADTGKMFQ